MTITSLRSRFLLLTASIFLLVGLGALLVFERIAGPIVHDLGARLAEKQALYDESRIGGLLGIEIAKVRALNRSPALRDWIENEDDATRRELALRELDLHAGAASGRTYNVTIRASRHHYTTDRRHPLRVPGQLWFALTPDNTWFEAAIRNGQPYQLNVETNPATGIFKVWINVLVRGARNEVIGVASSGIDIAVFLREFLAAGSDGMQRILVDRGGAIKVHPRTELMRADTSAGAGVPSSAIFDLLDRPAEHQRLRDTFAALKAQRMPVATLPLSVEGRASLVGVVLLEELDSFVLTVMDTESLVSESTLLPLGVLLLLSLLLTIGLVLCLFDRLIVVRLEGMDRAARAVAGGNYDVRLPARDEDEIGRLSTQFNRMAGAIGEYAAGLEARVEQRTAALSQSNAALSHANTELADAYEAAESSRDKAELAQQQATRALADMREAQAQLIHSEKMATLGQLVANVAHEINTPIGAIKSSGASIAAALGPALRDLPALLDMLGGSERALLARLLADAMAPAPVLGTREERAAVGAAARLLEQEGIADARRKAAILVQLQAHGVIADYLPLLRHPECGFVLATAHGIAVIIDSAANINTAVDQVSKTIMALKFFSRQDSAGERVLAPLAAGLETVLTIYQGKIKSGARLVREIDDIAPLLCHPDELLQVWTNLVHNALHAMARPGTLTVGLCRVGDEARVTVADTGCGIPDVILPRIFDPFFTTKPAGEGSGLGLDIVRRIVARHGGRIEVDSEVGVGTRFVVYLPYRAPPACIAPCP